MDKTSEKVTKDPRRVEQGKKSYETRMKRVKEKILKEKEDNRLPTPSTSSPTCGPTSSTSSSRCDLHLTIPQDLMSMALVYMLSLPLVFVYFLHILKLVNEKPDQPPKRRHVL